MAYKKSLQQGLTGIEAAVGGLKQVFTQQNEMFDEFVNDSISLNTDLLDFVKKRAELQIEYGKSLQNLCDRQLKKYQNLFERQRRSNKCNSSMFGCFYQLLASSRFEASDLIGLSQMTTDISVPLIEHALGDLKVNHSSFKKVLCDTQNELTGQSGDLVLNIKDYNGQFAAFKESQSKLDTVKSDMSKLRNSLESKGKETSSSSKFRSLEKSEKKRKETMVASRQKLNKSRNDYLLSLQALTHYRNKLFNDDIHGLFENLTCEFYHLMKVAFKSLHHAQVKRISNMEICNEKLTEKEREVDFRKEWDSLYDTYADCLEIPDSRLEFLPAYTKECLDSISSLQLDSDIEERYPIIIQNFQANLIKSKEIEDQIEASKRSIANMADSMRVDLSDYLSDLQNLSGSTGTLQNNVQCDDSPEGENGAPSLNGTLKGSEISSEAAMKRSWTKIKTQYSNVVAKYKELFNYSNKAARLKARKDLIESTFGGALETKRDSYQSMALKRQESVRITKYVPRPVAAVNVKLFGGDIEQYCKAIQKDIPPIVLSCIEFIREHGMFTQGIFRVNGAKSTVRYLKDYFEGGDDPLLSPSADSNSEEYEAAAVSELLKLYFRQLQQPPLPTDILTLYMKSKEAQNADSVETDSQSLSNTSSTSDKSEGSSTFSVSGKTVEEVLKNVLSKLPYSTMVTLRYLFAFLHSLTRFSDENMMDAYNLAIVWGPTLIRPEAEDLVALQNPSIELVQFMVINHDQVFPQDSGSLFSDTTSRVRPRTLSLAECGSMSSLADSIDTASPYSQNNNNISYDANMSVSPMYSQGSKLPAPKPPIKTSSGSGFSPSSDSAESLSTSSHSPTTSPKNLRHFRPASSVIVTSAALVSQPGEVVKEAAVMNNRLV